MEKKWADQTYLFTKAQRVVQQFAQKEAPRELIQQWIAGLSRRQDWSSSYLQVLGNYMPELLNTIHPNTRSFPETLTPMLRDLGAALEKLLEGTLQPTDGNDIALITAFGPDLLDQARTYFADQTWPPEPEQSYYHEHVADLKLVVDMKQEFEKVSSQLAHDVAALRQPDPPSR